MKKEKRKNIFKKMIKIAKMEKSAQNIINDVNSANIVSDQEFANKIFDKLLDAIYIEDLEE